MKNKTLKRIFNLTLPIPSTFIQSLNKLIEKYSLLIIIIFLLGISFASFNQYFHNGLGLAYNDARSHLDIGRRVVEGLKTGVAQLGSVWLPLNHVLMIPLVWSDTMWHSGFAGAFWNMISFVGTGILVFKFLQKLGVGLLGRYIAVAVFIFNINILYLQSTAMTELLLLFTMTAGCYYLMCWSIDDKLVDIIRAAFWIMLSTLTRYDGWFLLIFASAIITFNVFRKKGYKETEGKVILFLTLGALGIAMWFFWNLLIFKDPLYFAFGPYSAHAQQLQLQEANNLPTKGNIFLSTKIYLYALLYNSYTLPVILGIIGFITFWLNKKNKLEVKTAAFALTAPLFFNIVALIFGFSVLYVQGISGNTWFNARYGIMLAPTIAIFIGYLVYKAKDFKLLVIGLLAFVLLFAFLNQDAVTIDDAKVGSSQKNVTEVANWLNKNARDPGFILVSAASHDAIIFSSGLPMSKFIHEGTGIYWESAIANPQLWARWIVLRTYDINDQTYRLLKDNPEFQVYHLVDSYPFADIYELPEEYVGNLITKPIFTKNNI